MHLSASANKPRPDRDATPWEVSEARWRDVPEMVNMVVTAAAQGCFSPVFLDVRYQIGLALQLFSAVLRGRMAVHGQPTTRVTVRVVRRGQHMQGFALVREFPAVSASPHLELHLLAVSADSRRMGVGEALLQDCVVRLTGGQSLLLSTLTKADGMKRLVRKMGGQPLGAVTPLRRGQQALEAFVLGAGDVSAWQQRPWREWLGPKHPR